MDTQNSATTEVPTFKLAKVGKERNTRRRRGGAGGWFGGGSGSGGSGFNLLGGSAAGTGGGAAAGVGMSLSKVLVTLLITAGVSTGAWQFGQMMAGSSAVASKPAAKQVFDAKTPQTYADTSGVIKGNDSMPNSLGYVEGSRDGLTPAQRARKQAEAEAARKAQEAADAKAQKEEAAKETAASKAADKTQNTDTALNGGEGLLKKGLKPGKFGSLSSAFGGGGLSGGSGLSGGIARNFGGMSNLGGDLTKGQNGSLSAFHRNARPSMSRAASHLGRSNMRGALGQLNNSAAMTNRARTAGSAENAASAANDAFNPGTGASNVIAGPGVATGAGAGTGGATTPNNPGGGGVVNGGGASATCASGQYMDANGVCRSTGSNGGTNATPWQGLMNMAEMLLGIASAIAILMAIFKDSLVGTEIAMILLYVEMAIGAVVAGIGVMLMTKYHQTLQGGILTAVGAAVAYFAYASQGGFSSQAITNAAAKESVQQAAEHLAPSIGFWV